MKLLSRGALSVVAAALTGLALTGCGYSTNMRLPDGFSSVGIEYFENTTDLRNLEADLYQALSESVMLFVAEPLAAPDDSDLILRGAIIEYRRRGGVRNEFNRLSETGVRIIVEAQLFDRHTGQAVGELARITKETGYIVGEGSLDTSTLDETRRNPTLELQEERRARARTLRLLSEELVFELLALPRPLPSSED